MAGQVSMRVRTEHGLNANPLWESETPWSFGYFAFTVLKFLIFIHLLCEECFACMYGWAPGLTYTTCVPGSTTCMAGT